MKSKKNLVKLTSLSIVLISIMMSCNTATSNLAVTIEDRVDSIRIYYYDDVFLSFAAIEPEEFTQPPLLPTLIIKDSLTIKTLCDGLQNLKPDSLEAMDARAMLIFYKSLNDTLWVSVLKEHTMQLNRQIMQSDTVMWMAVRQVLKDRDSVFRHNMDWFDSY